MWNDYEEKISDQIVRTIENYTSQFPEVKVNKDILFNDWASLFSC